MTTDPKTTEAKPAHTPGPWQAHGRYVGTPNHATFICECRDQNGDFTSLPMGLANAQLIAAAPDMLAALKLAKQAAHWYSWHDPLLVPDRNSMEAKTSDAIDAAIAKGKAQ